MSNLIEPVNSLDYDLQSVAFQPGSGLEQDLAALLSPSAAVFGPDDSRWPEATIRYQALAQPEVHLIVQPGNEEDISAIILIANKHDLDYMLVNRRNSLTIDASNFSGLQIDVQNLRGISLSKEKETVRLQAGVSNGEVSKALFDQGYITTTGSGSCVSVAGPALGGGHGPYQGHHGLISDNIVSMGVVLTNGTSVVVDKINHPDLWWAMRGAGHNFGIVKSFDLKVHPVDAEEKWYLRQYFFSGDQLESVFEELNLLHGNGTMRAEIAAAMVVMFMEPSISSTGAVIACNFIYAGPQQDAEPHLAPFESINSIIRSENNVPYTEISRLLGGAEDSDLCAKGKKHITSTAGLQVYNISAERLLYDLYNQKVGEHPGLSDTKLVHQGYSVLGVSRQDPDDSAYPLRDDYLLMYFDATPAADSGLDDFVKEWADQSKDIWNEGQPGRKPTTYVNYARGDETLESMYGYEPWRLSKLRELKRRYDPMNKCRFYNPIWLD